MDITIGHRSVGPALPTLIIAEVAQAHDGSLGFAHAFIDAVAASGADAIKFQTHIANAESTLDEAFRIPLSGQDETRWDYWRRMEFTPDQWRGLSAHASEKGLVFLSSAFSVPAIELLAGLGMPAWKVGSGEAFNAVLIDAMLQKG
ncbi:MAG: N-acetylneuraminate synthase family protein, partial [Hyphomicrobiaceae bacterium]